MSLQDPDAPLASPQPFPNSDNRQSVMAPVINVLDQWGAETPFALPEEEGVNVLAVSLPQSHVCKCVWIRAEW